MSFLCCCCMCVCLNVVFLNSWRHWVNVAKFTRVNIGKKLKNKTIKKRNKTLFFQDIQANMPDSEVCKFRTEVAMMVGKSAHHFQSIFVKIYCTAHQMYKIMKLNEFIHTQKACYIIYTIGRKYCVMSTI